LGDNGLFSFFMNGNAKPTKNLVKLLFSIKPKAIGIIVVQRRLNSMGIIISIIPP